MRPLEIQHWLRAAPFRPFRVHLSDGSSHEVPHPELASLSVHHFMVYMDPDVHGIPRQSVMCDPMHVTRVEPIPTHDSGSRNGG
jgi:hypothetical protein